MSHFPAALNPTNEDVAKLLAAQSHLGTRNLTKGMDSYVHSRRKDGVYVLDLAKTWEKLMLAARVIAGIENPADVCCISAKSWGQRAVLKFAGFTGAKAIAGRFTPGTFTNQITNKYSEPRLLVVTDPKMDFQPIKEASYVNLPTIAFCHTDSPVQHIDIVIPCNNKGKHSIGLMWWLLTREVMRLRDPQNFPRNAEWDVMVDLFFYRDPEEEKADAAAEFGTDETYGDYGGDWGASQDPQQAGNWEDQKWAAGDDWNAAETGSWTSQGLDTPVTGWEETDQ